MMTSYITGMDDGDDEDYYEDEEDVAGSDDDDSSWKVRKNAVKVIAAVIAAQPPQQLVELYAIVGDELISRFKEREENVRVDVIHSFNCLLQGTIVACSGRSPALQRDGGSSPSARGDAARASRGWHPSVAAVVDKLPALVNASKKQLGGTSFKTKSAVFTLLRSLVALLRVRSRRPIECTRQERERELTPLSVS